MISSNLPITLDSEHDSSGSVQVEVAECCEQGKETSVYHVGHHFMELSRFAS
jgi:hypothetical protein